MQLTSANLKTFLDANPIKYPSGYPAGQIGNILMTPVGMIPNSGIPQIPLPVTTNSLMNTAPSALLSLASQSNYLSELDVIGSRVRQGDNQGIINWATIMNMTGKMLAPEYSGVLNLCSLTQNDPAYPTRIPGPSDLQSQFGVNTISNDLIIQARGF